jgi:hypothetical protein
MGINSSTSDDLSKNSFRHTIDYIATYYIVTMDFQSLNKLANREYCNELIILTSDIISKYATTRDIQYLVKRQGYSEDNTEPEMVTRKVTYFNKNMVESEIPEMVKKDMCMAIASFYIRIAHLFSAIILTINPIYKYRDSSGVAREVNWANRQNIPPGADVEVEYSSVCNKRITALDTTPDKNEQPQSQKGYFDFMGVGPSDVIMKPTICHLQLKPNMLIDEPGIKELEILYHDVYDYNEGKYTSMSPNSRQQYEEDVRDFYKSFTGKYDEPVPPEIKTFQDIPIRQYSKCNTPEFSQPITISKNSSLFQKYADNLNEMKRYAGINQDKLMDIIGKLFVYTINKKSGKKQIRINPRLSDALLDNLIQQSRTYISDLYKTCQRNYDKGVLLYQDIVETTISKTINNRIQGVQDEEYEELRDIRSINNDEIKPSNYRDFNSIGQYNVAATGVELNNNQNNTPVTNEIYPQPNHPTPIEYQQNNHGDEDGQGDHEEHSEVYDEGYDKEYDEEHGEGKEDDEVYDEGYDKEHGEGYGPSNDEGYGEGDNKQEMVDQEISNERVKSELLNLREFTNNTIHEQATNKDIIGESSSQHPRDSNQPIYKYQ